MNDPTNQSKPPPAPTHAEIEKRAYEIYVKRGFRQGQSRQNWLRAEQQLKNRASMPARLQPRGSEPVVPHLVDAD